MILDNMYMDVRDSFLCWDWRYWTIILLKSEGLLENSCYLQGQNVD